jgi:DHA3 family tetracycline resistance protein-like MFS transporter
MVSCLLAGGIAADRMDRRRVMIGADLARLVAVSAMGVLAVAGVIRIWELVALSLAYGCAEAFFGPSFGALVPQLVEPDDLVQANALQETLRPITLRLIGPAIGGVLVAAFGAGTSLIVSGATFIASIGCVALIARRPPAIASRGASARVQMSEGLTFVRAHGWLWGTLIAAAVSILVFWGPNEVLLPFRIRHELGHSAGDFGIVLAASGFGGVVGALTMSNRGLPKRQVLVLYLAWGFGLLPVAGYALVSATWALAALGIVFGFGMSVGAVIWSTLMQTRVPPEMLGRVTSLDWMVSLALTPLSFAATGPLAAAVGARATLIGSGLLGFILTFALYFAIRELRDDHKVWA